MFLPFVPAALGLHLVIAAPGADVPKVDIRKTCEIGASAMVQLTPDSTAKRDVDVCLNSEQSARDQILKNWSGYSSGEKAQCIQPSVYLPSYIEWLTCLEMESELRKENATQR